jgi:alkanesulfonate monooxygenase SsuD/methylene tetrahydromethanopterin reductase-like flavin-dependent oxidoreductase (luciferase family)
VRYYRERWSHYGHDPAMAAVGAGTAGYYAARTSQEAVAAYAPVFAGYLGFQQRLGVTPVFATLADFVERSSALIGSPQQVIDKVHRYHEQFGHTVMHLHAEPGGLSPAQHRASLELFQAEIAPALRRDIPDPPWPWAPVTPAAPAPAAPAPGDTAPADPAPAAR